MSGTVRTVVVVEIEDRSYNSCAGDAAVTGAEEKESMVVTEVQLHCVGAAGNGEPRELSEKVRVEVVLRYFRQHVNESGAVVVAVDVGVRIHMDTDMCVNVLEREPDPVLVVVVVLANGFGLDFEFEFVRTSVKGMGHVPV